MAFSFMRKYEKPIMFVIVVFCLSTIGVTGTMMQFFGGGKAQTAATFEVVPGKPVKVSEEDFIRLKRDLSSFMAMASQGRNQTVSDDETLTHIIKIDEAKASGIDVSDDEVATVVKLLFPGLTDAQYRMVVRSRGFGSADEFQGFLRDWISTQKLDRLTAPADRVKSEDVYNEFKKKSTRLSNEHVAFKAEDRLSDMNPVDYKTPEVKKWYDDKMNAKGRQDAASKALQERYKSPDKLDLEVVWADFAEFDPAKTGEWLKDRKVEDTEIRGYYDAHPDYFTVEAEKPKDPEKKDDAKAAEAPKAKPFDDVKEDIRKRILATSLVQKALDDANAQRTEKKPVLLDALATKYGIQYRKLSGVEKPKLESAELIGSKNLAGELGAQSPASFPTSVTANRPDRAYFTRIVAQMPAKTMPFDDVEASVRKDYMLDKAMEKAVADAEELKSKIEERAKEKVKDKKPEDLAAWEKELEEDKKNGVNLQEKSKDLAYATRSADMQKKKRDFDNLWQKESGAVFDELVKERGLQPGKLEAYTVVDKADESVKDEKDTMKKFFRTNHLLDSLEPGMCSSSLLRDE
ncbi:MAG: hypothetical protein HY292_19365 [Planctomycetes bacterium]|nr:hypothetical protein [Planctomycetota bacterium]